MKSLIKDIPKEDNLPTKDTSSIHTPCVPKEDNLSTKEQKARSITRRFHCMAYNSAHSIVLPIYSLLLYTSPIANNKEDEGCTIIILVIIIITLYS